MQEKAWKLRLSLAVWTTLLFCLCVPSTNAAADPEQSVPAGELAALTDLYDATEGDSWVRHDNWSNGGDPCAEDARWFGVACACQRGEQCHVLGLQLVANNLAGTLPSSIGNLSRMVNLKLSGNGHLEGTIPNSIADLSHLLGLELQRCSFAGPLPESIGALWNLQLLNLSENRFLDGELPSSLSNLTNVLMLNFGLTKLTGQLPTDIGRMTGLEFLEMPFANFHGPIPESLSELKFLNSFVATGNSFSSIPEGLFDSHFLTYVSLSKNNLTGTIPRMGHVPKLLHLDLRHNQLEGSIPLSISHAVKLEMLYLASNRLTGTIPQALDHCHHLHDVDLSGNLLTGTIPEAFESLLHLETLDLSRNQLTGTIPWAVLNDLQALSLLNASSNYLSGNLQLDPFSSVQYVDLHNNRIEGTIPPNQVKNLMYQYEYLDMSQNQLSGSLEASFFHSISNMGYLNLSHNNFEGSLAKDIFLDVSGIHTLDLSHNTNLTGDLPSELARDQLYEMRILDLSDCSFTGGFPSNYSLLNQLEFVDVSVNQLSYKLVLPTELEHITYFNISHNLVSSFGDASIPWLYTLAVLDLSYNAITDIPLQIRSCCFYGMGTEIILEHNPLQCSKPPIWTECVDVVCYDPVWPVDFYYYFFYSFAAVTVVTLSCCALLSLSSKLRKRMAVFLGVHSRVIASERRRRTLRRSASMILVVSGFLHLVVGLSYFIIGTSILLSDIERYCYNWALPATMVLVFFLALIRDIALLLLAIKQMRKLLWWAWLSVWLFAPFLVFWAYPTVMTTGQLAFDFLPRIGTFFFFVLEAIMAFSALLQAFLIEDGIILWEDLENKRRFEGEGDNGELIHCIYRNEEVILKRSKTMSNEDNGNILKEARILEALKDHPNFPEFLGTCYHSGFTHIVMHFERSGNALEYLSSKHRQLRENHMLFLARGVVQALQALHNEGIAHRDVTADNVLVHIDKLNKVVGILADLGNAIPWEWDWSGSHQAHALYEPPELISSLEHKMFPEGLPPVIDLRPADVFQFGVTLWEMCTRERWPGCSNYHQCFLPDVTLHTLEQLANDVPSRLRQLFLDCCDDDRHRRPTVLSISQRLRRIAQTGHLTTGDSYRVVPSRAPESARGFGMAEEYVPAHEEEQNSLPFSRSPQDASLPFSHISATRPLPAVAESRFDMDLLAPPFARATKQALVELEDMPAAALASKPARPAGAALDKEPVLPSPYGPASPVEMKSVLRYASSQSIAEEPEPAPPPASYSVSPLEVEADAPASDTGEMSAFISSSAQRPRTAQSEAALPTLSLLDPYA